MNYDDVANSKENPIPGTLYNKGGNKNFAKEVYEGCKIDYRGDDVNTATLWAVMNGDSGAVNGKPVLKTNQDSKVFINMVGMGGY